MTAVTDLIAQMRQYEYSGNVQTLMAQVEKFIAALVELEGGGDIALAGDVTGLANANTVVKWQNNAVKAGVPTADGQFYEWNAANADFELNGPGTLLNVQAFAASGTYTVTPGTHAIVIDMWGGGGGGGGCVAAAAGVSACAAGGGNPGSFTRAFINGAALAAIIATPAAIVIGAGGTGGTNAGGNTATVGGNTTVAISTGYTITGGSPGNGQGTAATTASITLGGATNVNSTGVANGGGVFNILSSNNQGSPYNDGVVISGAAGVALGGPGFAPSNCVTTGTKANNAGGNGNPGTGPACGGAGAVTLTNVARTGGNAQAGRVVVYEYA